MCKEYQQYCINLSFKAANVNFAMQQKKETFSVWKLFLQPFLLLLFDKSIVFILYTNIHSFYTVWKNVISFKRYCCLNYSLKSCSSNWGLLKIFHEANPGSKPMKCNVKKTYHPGNKWRAPNYLPVFLIMKPIYKSGRLLYPVVRLSFNSIWLTCSYQIFHTLPKRYQLSP